MMIEMNRFKVILLLCCVALVSCDWTANAAAEPKSHCVKENNRFVCKDYTVTPQSLEAQDGINFFSVFVPLDQPSLQLTQADKTIVTEYLQQQLAIYHLTPQAFVNLTPEQQRLVLAPGNNWVNDPELKAAAQSGMDLQPVSFNPSVKSSLRKGQTLSANELADIANPLPEFLVNILPHLDEGYERLLAGNSIILVDSDGLLIDILPNIL